ncbi:UNVERIFIED_CONTAM: hypothetical protein Sangu_2931800 [Sesamum angustifolium]|uniref:Tf2-1-like SH3-like domain-containing protein n=1 Tax=Sesamum angustifolium TaxID=2727405 RepID=A0AAW2ILT8_9LAMI
MGSELVYLTWMDYKRRFYRKLIMHHMPCILVKAEHQAPAGKFQPLSIPEWKSEKITIDFIVGLPRTLRKHDAIWVIVDRLTKPAHCLPIRLGDSLGKLAELYVSEIVRLHGVPVSIVSDRDPRFTLRFWGSLQGLEGPELVQETIEKIQIVKKCLKAAQDRQKSYVDKHRMEMEYEVADKVFLKVSPWKEILRFGKQEKLSPGYIGPYEIIERIGPLAYRLALPAELSQIHDVFHVSML